MNAQIQYAHDFDHRFKLLDCIIDYSIGQQNEKPKTEKTTNASVIYIVIH